MNSTNMPFSLIRKQLFEHYGWEFDSLTDRMLDTALELIAIELQLTKTDIIKQLPSNSQIREKLLDHLVIPETSFFRYPESFTFLKSIVHKWFLKNKGKKIRIASIPCATGEEPYSIAMSLLDAGINFEQFEIDALDISLPLIQKAKLGIYSTNKSIQYTQLLNNKYFDNHPAGLQIKTNLREHVNFIHGNITEMPATFFEKKYDIIFCRNLLIYLSNKHRQDLFLQLKKLLKQDGTLFVGPVEVNFFTQQGLLSLNKCKTYALNMSAKPLNTTFNMASKNKPTLNKMSFSPYKQKISSYKPVDQGILAPSKYPTRSTRPQVEKATDVLKTARELANTGHFKEALTLINPIIDKSKQVELYLLHGEILLALKLFSDAMLTFKKALYLQSKNKEALHHLALLSQRMGDDENARRYFKRLNSNLEA